VSDQEGEHDLVVPQRGIWGTAGVGGWNIDKCAAAPCHPAGCCRLARIHQTHSTANAVFCSWGQHTCFACASLKAVQQCVRCANPCAGA
jgi:hypothetical protein